MKKILKRGMSGLLAVLMAFTVLAGFGTTTAFAANETAESYMISFPRDGDAAQIYSADAWGHSAKNYMNGWATGSSNYTTLHCMDSFDGKVCYCIEPGLSRNVGDTYYGFGEDFWDNYPSQYNNTIQPDDIKLLLGRIMQYGYQGNLSTSWRSQNDSDADKLAHAFATQLLVWETVVGERDADFDHVSTGGYDEILSLVSPNHPLYSRIMDYYDSIEYSVQSHAVCPSFMSRSSGGAKTIELAWDGSQYVAELTDTNRVLSQFTFSASETGFHFSVSGNTLTITTDTAPSGNVTISASRSASRCGVLVWTDYKYGPNGGVQDTITYTASVSDPVRAFLKLKVSYGGAKIIKTSEDGKVDDITFTITGEGVNQTVTTDRNGEIRIDNLMPGTYTVTEQSYDKYEPQESHRVTVLAGQTATVSFNNVLRRGDLTVTKTSDDGLNQGVKFHLFGTSLSGLPVDEYAVTDENGVAAFKDVLIGTGYTLEEMDAAIRYVIPDSQSAAVEWNSVTNKSFSNILKKFNVTVTKSDCEVGTAQGDASLAGAAYPDADIKAEQEKLNRLYDDFSKKYGLISARANNSAFNSDSSYCLLASLEVLDDEGNFLRKADMFSKRTIKQKVTVQSVDTASEAYALSLAEKARIDMPYMSQLTGKTEQELFEDLKGVIFLNPMHISEEDGKPKYLPADEYLSGNVREKLEWARRSAELYPEDYSENVRALEAVQPVDLTASEISVRLGATWLPPETIEEFMFELFSTPRYCQWNIHVHYAQYTGEWNVEGKSYDRSNVKAHNTYGTGRVNGYKIMEETLNLRDVRIFDYIEDGNGRKTAVLNKKETAIAQGKQELIKQAFADWIWSDPERREQLTKLYNEKFNSIRPREYDGSHLNFVGINPEITLRPHQVNAIAHILYGGNTLLAHVVGAGKSATRS